MVEIRRVNEQDLDAWARLRNTLWPDDLAGHTAELSAYFAGNGRGIETALTAVGKDGRLVGFIELNIREYAEGHYEGPVPYIEGWFVSEEMRGRGVGRLLVAAAESWALQLGYDAIASDTETTNLNSIAAHRALGFTEAERVVCFIKPLS